ncbi:MAG: hypothetical protein GDA37_02215 [Ekhidna sp.]|nr:hypothetical protein [Ekhidna sp.]
MRHLEDTISEKRMFLVVDSGSTKTDWCLVNQNGIIQSIQTEGINPLLMSPDSITDIIVKDVISRLKGIAPDHIRYYGAGCGTQSGRKTMMQIFNTHFTESNVTVESDMLGACRAMFNHNSGICAILGTGTGSCYYDGRTMTEFCPGLGYALGDEGSGAYLGKQLVVAFERNLLPAKLREKLAKSCDMSDIVAGIYEAEYPSKTLADFSLFIAENRADPFINQLVTNAMELFFERFITIYSKPASTKIGIIGSIGYHFSSVIKAQAIDKGFNEIYFLKSPIENLANYHLNAGFKSRR